LFEHYQLILLLCQGQSIIHCQMATKSHDISSSLTAAGPSKSSASRRRYRQAKQRQQSSAAATLSLVPTTSTTATSTISSTAGKMAAAPKAASSSSISTSTTAAPSPSTIVAVATARSATSDNRNEKTMKMNGKKKKHELHQLLMHLDTLKGWATDIITMVVDYGIDMERLLLMGFKTEKDDMAMIWSLSIESLYRIMTDGNNRDDKKSNNNDHIPCNDDIKWLSHDVHPQYHGRPHSQFYSVVMIHDDANDRIIVTGGGTNSFMNWNDIQNNISSAVMHPLTPMPTPRYQILHTSSGDRSHEYIFMGGEMADSGQIVEVYNMATNEWSELPGLPDPSPRSSISSACAVDPRNGSIYVFGGGTHNYDCIEARNTVDYYDPMTKCWHQVSSKMNRKRYGPAVIWLPNLNSFLISGGSPSSHGDSGLPYAADDYDPIDDHLYRYSEYLSIEMYSPDTKTFTLLPSSWSLPVPRGWPNHQLHFIDRFLLVMYHSPEGDPGTQFVSLSPDVTDALWEAINPFLLFLLWVCPVTCLCTVGYIADISDIKLAIEEGGSLRNSILSRKEKNNTNRKPSASAATVTAAIPRGHKRDVDVKPLKWCPLPSIGTKVSQLYSLIV
jgi:hypothetical protein